MTIQRFMSKVCVCDPNDCWEWQAGRDENDIYKIRELVGQGYTNQQIADMFNVAKATISHVRTRRNWGHI